MKKVFGLKNKKKTDESDEDNPSYTDPSLLHATDPSPRISRGITHPVYPPPRPCHSGGNSPNPRRKYQDPNVPPSNRKGSINESNRNSLLNPPTGEPMHAPQRTNTSVIISDENDYADPIDAQRRDELIHDMKNKSLKDDYCEPWDSTMRTDAANVIVKKPTMNNDNHSDYVDPYDTGKDIIIDKRLSRGIDPRRSGADIDSRNPLSTVSGNDYDTPWDWVQKNTVVKSSVPSQQSNANVGNQTNKGDTDDYDEPWEKKQSYLFKTQVPGPGGKPRSPVPLPRQSHASGSRIFESSRDASKVSGQPVQVDRVYDAPWDGTIGKTTNSADDYDMPWEYKNKLPIMGKPPPFHPVNIVPKEIDPNTPLDQQSWYHGRLTRQQAEELLSEAPDCSYLVRDSESSKKDFSLSMKNNENFLHLKIVRQLNGEFILGQFSKPFPDIPKVIYHYSKNKLNIRGAEHKYLQHPISSQPEYHTIEPDDDENDVAL